MEWGSTDLLQDKRSCSNNPYSLIARLQCRGVYLPRSRFLDGVYRMLTGKRLTSMYTPQVILSSQFSCNSGPPATEASTKNSAKQKRSALEAHAESLGTLDDFYWIFIVAQKNALPRSQYKL